MSGEYVVKKFCFHLQIWPIEWCVGIYYLAIHIVILTMMNTGKNGYFKEKN